MVFNIHGWRQLKLEEIAEIVGGGTPAREPSLLGRRYPMANSF